MDDIVFTLEFSDDLANGCANRFLEKGWRLLHVGTKLVDIHNGQAYYNTTYVVGANKAQHKQYLVETSSSKKLF